MIEAQQLERVISRLDRGELSVKEQEQLLSALSQEIDRRSSEDFLFWLRYARTRDEADTDNPVKPVPIRSEPYLRLLVQDIVDSPQSIIAKSRQMFVTWAIALYCVWWARYKPNQAVYYQTQTWEDAVAMVSRPEGYVEGRMQFIETHLPSWMTKDAKFTEGAVQYPNGSIIQALAGGAGKIRGKTPSLYVGDEFAHMDDQDKVWTAVGPLLQKGSKIILCSTPNGSDNTFCTLWHGYALNQAVTA